MELKHFSEAICKFNVINPQIVDITKKIIVIIGCPGLSNRLDDVVTNIVIAHACHRVDDRNYYNTEFGLQKYCFDDSHPVVQIALVKTLVEEMKNDGLAPHVFVYTNSPFVLQAFFHFNGRPAGDIEFYECGFNETGREILLTDVSADTRTAFAHMADAMNSIMDVTEVFSKKHDAELRRPKFVRFTKEIDYWLEMVELNGKIYDQMDDVAAWSNLRKDFPSLVNDKDEIVGVGLGMPDISDALRKCGGHLFPLGWYYLIKALKAKQMDSFSFLLIAVRPDYQDKGINALFFEDQIPIINQYGIKRLETTSILETNTKNIANFTQFDHKIHKRHRAYIKPL